MWSVVEQGARLSKDSRTIVRTSAFELSEIRSHLSFLKHREWHDLKVELKNFL